MRRVVASISLLFFLAVLAFAFADARPVSAQMGPSGEALDRMFADLSTRVGRPLSRARLDGTWSWEEIRVQDNNLGCPTPGNAAPGATRAFRIVVNLTDIGTYDYRMTRDEQVLFLCSGTGVGAPGAVATVAPGGPGTGVVVPQPAQPPVNTTNPTQYSAPVLAYVAFDGNVYVTSMGVNPGPTALTGDANGRYGQSVYWQSDRLYSNLVWSPDGSRLAFTDPFGSTVNVVTSGQPVSVAARGVYAILPAAWSPDGGELAYAVSTGGGTDRDTIFQIQAVSATGAARAVGTISYGTGCGGGGFSPSTQLYYGTAGYYGHPQALLWTPAGFIHSTNCIGVGVALTNFAGQRVWEQRDVARVALSPDGRRLVGLVMEPENPAANPALRRSTGLALIDVTTGALTPLAVNPNPDQVAWNGDGSTILYSTRTLGTTVQGNAASTLGPQVLPAWPVSAESYTIGLYSVPVAGGPSTQIFIGEGFSVARITASPISALTVFGIIESELALFTRLNTSATLTEALGAAPRMRLASAVLSTPPGQPTFFDGNGSSPALSRASSFLAIPSRIVGANTPVPTFSPAVGSTSGDNPLGLLKGGRAVVPPGGNVNIRSAPTTSQGNNVIGLIRPGDSVVILEGPVFADNLRWWQVRREADGLTGWVVDQYVNANGQVENNLLAVR